MNQDAQSPFDKVAAGPESAPAEAGGPSGVRDGAGLDHPSVEALRTRLGDGVVHTEVSAGDQHVVFVDPARNVEALTFLRDDPDQRYDLLVDVTGVDYGGGRPLQVVYQLWSIPHRRQLRLKCELPLSALRIATVVPLWSSADWLEREVYDLFGIEFEGHPDLRRILMPANYAEGHPLRKDFPLRGRFSRAEQTRRALAQQVEDHYIPSELDAGRAPQVVTRESGAAKELPSDG